MFSPDITYSEFLQNRRLIRLQTSSLQNPPPKSRKHLIFRGLSFFRNFYICDYQREVFWRFFDIYNYKGKLPEWSGGLPFCLETLRKQNKNFT
jgi:hypothetical protein